MKTSVKKLLAIFSIFAVAAITSFSLVAAEEDWDAAEEGRMTAVFINSHPRDEITLYWVNPDLDEDDPERFVSSSILL